MGHIAMVDWLIILQDNMINFNISHPTPQDIPIDNQVQYRKFKLRLTSTAVLRNLLSGINIAKIIC